MYNPFTIGRRFRQQKKEIAELRETIRRQEQELLRERAHVALLKQANSRYKKMLECPPAYAQHQKIGPLTVLEVNAIKGLDMEKVGAVATVALYGIAVILQCLSRRPIAFPELPEVDVYRYRIYDEDAKMEREVGEREFKALVKEKTANR